MNKNTILFVIMLIVFVSSARAFSAPAFYWDSSKPSWYDSSLQPGQYKITVAPEYGSANFTFSQSNNLALTPTVVWSTATDYTLYGGKALLLEVDYSQGLQSSTVTLTPTSGSTLFPMAVAAYIYTTSSISFPPNSASLTLYYSDGTNQTASFSGTASANTWTLMVGYINASKTVTKIVLNVNTGASGSYFLKWRIYIEYSALKTFTYSFSGNTVAVTMPSLFNASFQYFKARFPKPLVSISPSAQLFIDEAYGNSTGTYTATLSSYTYVYTLAQKYVVSLLDASTNILGGSTGSGKVTVASDANATYLKLNTTLLYSASFLNNTVLNPPQAGTSTITFTVQDYGAGYQVLEVADLQGRIAGSSLIGSTGQVAMNLTPYASYVLQVSKPGLSKTVGLVTISSSNIQLAVMPTLPTVRPASWLSASYDYADKELIVNVSCQYPPCFVTVKKVYANGTQALYTLPACQQPLCSYVVISPDPYFQITANDTSGRQAQTSTGLSVPLWNSPLGNVTSTLGKTINLDAWGVNVNDFIVFLIGLAIIYAAFTYRNWELGIIVFGVWLSVGTLLLGGSGNLMVPGLSLALVGATLSYMLKREQQP